MVICHRKAIWKLKSRIIKFYCLKNIILRILICTSSIILYLFFIYVISLFSALVRFHMLLSGLIHTSPFNSSGSSCTSSSLLLSDYFRKPVWLGWAKGHSYGCYGQWFDESPSAWGEQLFGLSQQSERELWHPQVKMFTGHFLFKKSEM